MAPTQVLLEHLASAGWFASNGEVALTSALTFCLNKDPAASEAFVSLLRERTDSEEELAEVSTWRAECSEAGGGGRADIAGWASSDESQAPVIVVEAKVSAHFGTDQVVGYLQHQQTLLHAAGCTRGLLAPLVPQSRLESAQAEVDRWVAPLGAKRHGGHWSVPGEPEIKVVVISWDEAIGRMSAAAGDAKSDLEQLLGACRALQGADVVAFSADDIAGGWRDRQPDIRIVLDRVTRGATAALSLKLSPWQMPSGGLGEGFRYLGRAEEPNLAVGMRADGLDPAFWVRWHSQTHDFYDVGSRLDEAGISYERVDGHIWVPLTIDPDSGIATRQIESLVDQVVRLYDVTSRRDGGDLRG